MVQAEQFRLNGSEGAARLIAEAGGSGVEPAN